MPSNNDALLLQGDKDIIKFEGDHNSPRPQFYFDSINIFFHNVLQPPEDEEGATFYDFGKASWAVPEVGFFFLQILQLHLKKQADHRMPLNIIDYTQVPSDIPSEENNPGCQYCSSPSDMISFELSNASPLGPHVMDDQFVEYELDDFTGFPCNVEEEERMFMDTCSTAEKGGSVPLESTATQVEHHLSTLVVNGSDFIFGTCIRYTSIDLGIREHK
ncbi:ARM repeat superfamily protein [Hibiscus syriacus]|uniref:ARM repeat superfamily protein n=1 Tax=Hibiscus syriacus TaxID=106335 RepID=A0A6A2XEH8_HIBSY|nr:ARM repeat superfamily protein [Hibiscus syriacus]